ncbi:PadR family transcriptional regulator [Janibacter sp. GXQ6167]|uniref:PadR family transcriptional regulator n=1 Tax=Janibacter sp. GXQ6167 TaxID=3240791 RepID=UPI0035257FAB
MPHHDPQMLKGVLSLLLLSLLDQEDGYGYAVLTQLREGGFDELTEGAIYPALTRLESAGHLTSYLQRSDSGPARKYYRITDEGRSALAERRLAWGQLAESVHTILTTSRPSPKE